MAWSARKKKKDDDRASGDGAEWIHQMSIAEATDAVRKQWKENGIHAESGDWVLIQLAHVAIMRGLTRKTAPLVVRLLERREAEGKLAWHLDGSLMGAVGISIVRLMAAYLEDPAVSLGKARAAVDLFLRSIEKCDDLKTVHQLMPMILAVRTGTAAEFAAAKRRSGLPLRAEMQTSGMCTAAHRQWRVEYLLATGEEDEALELAHRGRSDKPCGGTCAFAPHSMFAWLLEPLHRRGRKDEARVLHDRLDGLHTPRALYLDAMGCRIHYLALEGRFQEAGNLLHMMRSIAKDEDASPRQRLKFYEGCARAMELAATEEDRRKLLALDPAAAEALQRELLACRDALREAFAARAA